MATYNFYSSNKEIHDQAKDGLRGSWGVAASASAIVFLLCFVPLVLTILLSVFVVWWLSIPLALLTLFIWAVMSYGYSKFCLKIAKQELPVKRDIFAGFSRQMGNVIRIAFKRLLLSIFWLIILVLPCFVKNIGYSMSLYLLADRKDITSENALAESKHIMQQNYGRYFRLLLSNILLYLLVVISAGIAWIWIGPLLETKKAVFYENLKTEF